MRGWRTSAMSALLVACCGAAADGPGGEPQTALVRGWAALRALDCARCHGRDYNGWAAPSLLVAVRDAPRERFRHFVLEGDPARGMPGYKSQPLVVAELDAMYAYLRARADAADAAAAVPATPGRGSEQTKPMQGFSLHAVVRRAAEDPQRAEATVPLHCPSGAG